MKAFKFLLVSLLVMLGTTAFAQDVMIHMKDGTEEVIANVDSVVYETHDIGYYSFNATSIAEIKNLTASDFTKLTKAPSEVTCGKNCYPVVLTTGTIAPIMMWPGQSMTMDSETDYSGLTITINDTKYNVWCLVNPISATYTPTVKIEINY